MSRYEMRKTHQGYDMYDSDDQSYLNTDEAVERMNELDKIEKLSDILKNMLYWETCPEEYRGRILEVFPDEAFDYEIWSVENEEI